MMLALPVQLITGVFAVALASQMYDQYSTQVMIHQANTDKAMLYLTTEVCTNSELHAKLEEFNKCFDSRLILSTTPGETALRFVLSNLPSIIMGNLPVYFLAKSALASFVLWVAVSWIEHLSNAAAAKQKTC